MIGATYSFGEVAWLNSLSEAEAVDLTAAPRGALGHVADGGGVYTGSDANDDRLPLPVIARWLDVQAAKKRLRLGRDVLAMVQLRAQGVSEEQIAAMFSSNHKSVGARVKSAIRDITNDLNQYAEVVPERLGHVSMCLHCGVRPRARLCAIRRHVRGGWKTVQPGKQASVCAECLSEDLRFRLVAGPLDERDSSRSVPTE
jgi:hypothetical protein